MSKLRKFVILLLVIVLAFPSVIFGYFYFKLKTMQNSDSLDSLNSLDYEGDNDIKNVLLLGTDGRPGENAERSDAMMILTIDNKHKSLKLTSLGRDTYVDIPGHGKEKLTHAYFYGKEDLLIETIEQNFRLDIHDYAQVNFYSFMDIIEVLDGVVVDVQQSEIKELNKFINETYRWYKNPNKGEIKYIKKPGRQNLNAYQALSFSRIRKNDGTMERDSRQRQVIEAMISKLAGLPINKYNELLDSILPYVETNMSPGTIIGYAKSVLAIGDFHIKSLQFPFHPEYEVRLESVGYVIPFEEYEVDILHDFIFKDIIPTEELIKAAEEKYGRTVYSNYSPSDSQNNSDEITDTETDSIDNSSLDINSNHSDSSDSGDNGSDCSGSSDSGNSGSDCSGSSDSAE